MSLPAWALPIRDHFAAEAANTFLLHGNVHDRFAYEVEPPATLARGSPVERRRLGSFTDFLVDVFLPPAAFDVVLTYDVGNGIRALRGEDRFAECREVRQASPYPSAPRPAIELLTHYFRFAAIAAQLAGGRPTRIACIVRETALAAPHVGASSTDANAVALLLREWATDPQLVRSHLVVFLLTETLNDLNPLLAASPAVPRFQVPQPDEAELERHLTHRAAGPAPTGPEGAPAAPGASPLLSDVSAGEAARLLVGCTLASVESLVRLRLHQRRPLAHTDLVAAKKALVETQNNGLIEFLPPTRTFADLAGNEPIKTLLRQDLELLRRGERKLVPMGYLICGPVGTGKTFLTECLAGEAGIPVVKLKNFRDKWVGSSEGNLERIFRLLHALGRCFVFIDEADQALGSRQSSGDSGVSSRIYQMFAEEMSNRRNQGRLVWILATSRPDLVEVDLKRPGRVDTKIPIFPTIDADESWTLLRAIARGFDLPLAETLPDDLRPLLPVELTAGAASTLLGDVAKRVRREGADPLAVLRARLENYRAPVSPARIRQQIRLAVLEASDLALVPPIYRHHLEEDAG